jgi:methylthioribose-1-phosphate isomerase
MAMSDTFPMPTLYGESVVLDEDTVRILDRRIFPFEKRFVVCRDLEAVADAIEKMVTQSNGPFYAAGGAMVLAARRAAGLSVADRNMRMREAADRLIRTRPTNNNIRTAVAGVLEFVHGSADAGPFLADAVEAFVRGQWEDRRQSLAEVGSHAASLFSDGERLMTYCWSEGALVETLACLLRAGKRVELICPETRPYLQGARLTAHSAAEMGIPATVITDGMCAHAMAQSRVTMLMTAADRVTMSGHVINKIGTLQAAIAARHFAIPYFATVVEPDPGAPTPASVRMEERDPDEVLHCLGKRTASPLAKGWYPAFDITPPELVSAIVTWRGIFAPRSLAACGSIR